MLAKKVVRGMLPAAAASVVAAVVLVVASGADAGAGGGERDGSADPAGGVRAAGRAAAVPAGEASGAAAVAPEADLSHHGHVSLADGRLVVTVMSRNHGPAALAEATVRLELSHRPTGELRLPGRCLRAAERVVLCGTGPLSPDGVGRRVTLGLELGDSPSEAVVTVATAWSGGATDRNPANSEHRVLVPATGDPYAY
ncbi:hypothetical protein [Streptomyces genisteinicus]|uniref:hypothetical protein n=1 Tax=Streptomyces genisteinicus TaxID=2768068 RepID=UPI001FE8C2BC|nr:hypothetical protein [Streptomyces genisteinicus]